MRALSAHDAKWCMEMVHVKYNVMPATQLVLLCIVHTWNPPLRLNFLHGCFNNRSAPELSNIPLIFFKL